MNKNKTIVISIVSILILTIAFFVFNKKPVKEPEIVTSEAFVNYQTPKQIVDSSDLIIEVEVLDDLTEQNSVLVESEGIVPVHYRDSYVHRLVNVKKIIKGEEHAIVDSRMKIVEPIAIKNNKIYELTVYPYKTSLKKGQLVTLFLEEIANGDFSIKLFGNAQINPQLESSYSAPLDLYLNSDEKTSDLIGSLYLAGQIEVDRNKVKSIDLVTPSKTYNIHYLELVETNQLFVIIENVGYFTSLDKSFK